MGKSIPQLNITKQLKKSRHEVRSISYKRSSYTKQQLCSQLGRHGQQLPAQAPTRTLLAVTGSSSQRHNRLLLTPQQLVRGRGLRGDSSSPTLQGFGLTVFIHQMGQNATSFSFAPRPFFLKIRIN